MPGRILKEDPLIEKPAFRVPRYDPLIALFSVAGSLLILMTALAILTIAIPELADPIHLLSVAGDPAIATAFLLTFSAGCVAVGLLVVFGTPLAYVMNRVHFRGKSLVESLIDIPLVLPHTVAGLMIYLLFMSRGLIGAPFAEAGVFFEDAYPGIVAAMVFVSMPYYVNGVREGFAKVPVRLENVARTLGATAWKTFLWISLPLVRRHIISSGVVAWGRAVGEFAAVVMIAYFPMVVSTLIYQRFSTGGLAESRSVAFLMILVCFILFFIVRWLTHRMEDGHDQA